MEITEITNIDSPQIELYTGLNEKQVKKYFEPEIGAFICESKKVIERALGAGYEPISFFLEKTKVDELRPLIQEYDVPVYAAEYDTMRDITGYALTGGVLAALRRKPLQDLEAFLYGKNRLVILDDIENPTNIGAIFRSAAALGADGVLLTPGCADPLYRRAARVSMGTVFAVDWTLISYDDVSVIKDSGFTISSLALSDRAESLGEVEFSDKSAIVLGNEDKGVSERILSLSNHIVMIPMQNGVDSLNVAAASAVAFWEVFNK